jgi:HlyD family secretion protein
MRSLWGNVRWRITIIVGVVLLVIAVSVLAKRGPDPVETKTITLAPRTMTVKLPENGVLSRPQTATISASTAGNILHVYAREGQRVKSGDLLMKLDDRQIAMTVAGDRASVAGAQASLTSAQARLQADINAKQEGQISGGLGAASIGVSGAAQLVQSENTLQSAKLNLQTAKDAYDADRQLYQINGLARQQLNKDKAAYDEAVANLRAAQQQYDLLKQQLRDTGGQMDSQIQADRVSVTSAQAQLDSANAALSLHQSNLADTEVRAPFDGVIQQLGSATSTTTGTAPLAAGDTINPGQVLFTIAGAGPMVVKAQVDEQDIINVKVGQRAHITGEDFPGRTLDGTVSNIAAIVVQVNQAGNSAKNVETTISLDRDYSFLRAGMSCDVDIITGQVKNAIVVPLAAIVDEGGKHYVFVVKKDKVRRVLVHKGLASDTEVVITDGLARGDVVATTNVKSLKDAATVRPLPVVSPSPSSGP